MAFRLSISTMNQVLIRQSDDYNSWQESLLGRWKRRRLDKDVILAEGISLLPGIIYRIDLVEFLYRLQRIQHAPAHFKLDGRSA